MNPIPDVEMRGRRRPHRTSDDAVARRGQDGPLRGMMAETPPTIGPSFGERAALPNLPPASWGSHSRTA